MNNNNIQREFELEHELESWLVWFDPQDRKLVILDLALDTGKMPLEHEMNMRLRLDDRFNKSVRHIS